MRFIFIMYCLYSIIIVYILKVGYLIDLIMYISSANAISEPSEELHTVLPVEHFR